ncbi:pseudouridine synthase [Enterococcus sp. AZ103]|uniref:pseudouridine synthase n=1 Tax=Enterococcus sp. AZ103 TaxID=2774628 RepID=UPI003F212FE1
MRLDKFLSEVGLGSRKEVKQLIKKGQVKVNQVVVKSDKTQVDPEKDQIAFLDAPLIYQEFYYYVLNKPAGVISATSDPVHRTVLDLFSSEDYRTDLFPVGRLDKDTEGLLIITNDGELGHQLLSPKKHVEKEYFAEVSGIMDQADQEKFEVGIILAGEKMLPAKLMIDEVTAVTSKVRIILQEGKFHQVKRMVKACGKEVTYLKRIRMGQLTLPVDLKKGQYRALTDEELVKLKE